jgi:anti-repressor protein
MRTNPNSAPLIKVEQNAQGDKVVSARELHEFLEIKSKFADWMQRRIEEYGFVENHDFTVILKNENNLNGGNKFKEYAISLDMAKELAMVERNEKGREARQYFIACEKELRAVKKVKNSNPSHRLMRRISPVHLADMLYNCCFVESKEVRENLARQLYAETLCSTVGKKGGQDVK